LQCQRLARARRVAASKDNTRAILSYATPNPVGPYKLVTPIAPPTGAGKTKTPILPVMGGALVNLPTPVMPTKQTTPVAPPLPGRLVNVPTPPMADKSKSNVVKDLDDLIDSAGVEQPEFTRVYGQTKVGLDRYNEDLLTNSAVKRRLDTAAEKFANDAKLQARYKDLLDVALSYVKNPRDPYQYDEAKQIAALNVFREVQQIRDAKVPVEEIPNLIMVKKQLDIFDLQKTIMNPGARDTFAGTGRFVSDGVLYQRIGNDLRSLDKAGRETYFALLPGWTGTHKELQDAARSLSK